MDVEQRDSTNVAQGVYDLCIEGSTDWYQRCHAWLKEYYERHGLDPADMRRDVLAYGHDRDALDLKYSLLLAIYVDRLELLERHCIMGVANDCDPAGPHPAHWTHQPLELTPLRRCDLPEVRWRPFKLVARIHVWTFKELAALVRRQSP
jgi:hypothetical protein